MNMDFSQDELYLLEALLAKEDGSLGVEVLHSRNFEYEQYLKNRQELVRNLLAKIQNILPANLRSEREASI